MPRPYGICRRTHYKHNTMICTFSEMLLKAALSCLLLAGACVARAPLSITELKDVIDHLGDEILEHKSINSASGFPMVDEIEGREDDTEDQDLVLL